MDSGKSYHRQCTGDALVTAQNHQALVDITLFGSCFCPFVQRVWVTLEYLEIPYRVSLALFLDFTSIIVLPPVLSEQAANMISV
jgi:hypothetical protein